MPTTKDLQLTEVNKLTCRPIARRDSVSDYRQSRRSVRRTPDRGDNEDRYQYYTKSEKERLRERKSLRVRAEDTTDNTVPR